MLSDIQDLLRLIEIAFSSADNSLRQNAESTIVTQCSSQPQGINILVQIVMNRDNSDFIRESTALLTIAVVKRLLTQPMPYDPKLQMAHAECLIDGLKSGSTSSKLKSHLSTGLSHLQMYSSRSEENKLNLRIYLQLQCIQVLGVKETLDAGLYLFQALLSNVDQFQVELVQQFFMSGRDIVQSNRVEQMKLWSSCGLELCKKVLRSRGGMKDSMLKLQNQLIYNEQFSLSLIQVIIYMPQQDIQNIICQTNDQQLNQMVNESKSNSLNSYNLILDILFNDRSKSESTKSPFYIGLLQLLPTLIVSLITYTTSNQFDLDQINQSMQLSNIITQTIKFIALCGGQSEFYELFSQSKTSLIVDVILPIITTSKQEYQQMIDEPEEFVSLALDTIDKQTSDIPKTSAAQLLETLCDHIDGCTTFISQLSVMIINHSIKLILNQPIDQQFNHLQELQNRLYFTKFTPIQRVDSCMLCLTVMSYILSRRADLIMLLDTLLSNNIQYFSNPKLDPLIATRLALFLGYYCDNIIKVPTTTCDYKRYIQILIDFIQHKPQTQAIMYQSIDALKNIFENEDIQTQIQQFVVYLFPVLCQSLLQSNYEQHFDMIMNIMKDQSSVIVENESLLTQALDTLVQRIILEQHNVNQGQKDRQIWINKAWNIIRQLPETKDYLPRFMTQIEQYLLPLYQMLDTPELIEFDEDVFLMVSAMIEKCQCVTEVQSKLLHLSLKILHKQKGRLGQMFEMLNNYLHYGDNVFQQQEYQQLLLNIAITTMNSKNDVAAEADEGEGVLLIHFLIQKYINHMSNDVLRFLFGNVISRSSKEVEQDFLKSRLMGVFLSGFLVDFNRCRPILQDLGFLQPIINKLVADSQVYQLGYDIKLFVYTMSRLIQSDTSVFNSYLIDSMVGCLLRQQKYEEKKAKNNSNLNDSEDSEQEMIDSDDSEDIFNEEKHDAELSMESYKSQIKDIDEYMEFKTAMFRIKETNPQLIDRLKSELTAEKLGYVQQVLSFSRINTQNGLGAPRKILTARQKKK